MNFLFINLFYLFYLGDKVNAQCNFKSGNYIEELSLPNQIKEIKIDSKCRIYDKVAVKINQWSLTKLDENSPLIETIEKNLEPFIKK